MRNLSLGDRGKEVTDVQTRLRGLGFELGGEGVDGFFGPQTETAVKAFQQERGLLVDGVVGANTWRELVEAGYALGDRLLYLRVPPFRGDDVLPLQVKLNLLGFNAGPERGILDEDVERAVLEFQRNAGLPPTASSARARCASSTPLRKAESGREGKKIPDRDARLRRRHAASPARSVVIDPGHGGSRRRRRLAAGRRGEGLHAGARPAAGRAAARRGLPRARSRASSDERVPLYARPEAADAARRADFFISLHCNHDESPAARGAACYYFQRSHYYSEHGQRLADVHRRAAGARRRPLPRQLRPQLRRPARAAGIAVLVEPFFLSNPEDEELARRPDYVETLARALVGGLADYLARVPTEHDGGVRDTRRGCSRFASASPRRSRSACASWAPTPLRARRALRRRAGARRGVQAARGRAGHAPGARRLQELRDGGAPPQLVELERALAAALTGAGLRPGRHAAHHRRRRARKMGIEHGHPLRDQVFWVEDGRCLRPMLAPNLYTLMRRLGRIWCRPFGIFEIGSCFRRDTKGSEPPQRVHDAQPRRAGQAARRAPRAPRGARGARHGAPPASTRLRARVHRVRGLRRRRST